MNNQMYTVFNCANEIPCDDCDHLNCITLPNDPRQNLAGTEAIATGIFEKARDTDARYLTQSEAEMLMQTTEWTLPETDPEETTE